MRESVMGFVGASLGREQCLLRYPHHAMISQGLCRSQLPDYLKAKVSGRELSK